MYNITNPLHYIAANAPEATTLLLTNYGLQPPITHQELFEAVDYAYSQYGEQFVSDMNVFHPDKEIILEASKKTSKIAIEDDFKVRTALLTPSQLNSEIDSLNAQLSGPALFDEALRLSILEKINYLRELIKSKTVSQSLVPVSADHSEANKINKTNQYILISLMAIALMYFGSKIIRS